MSGTRQTDVTGEDGMMKVCGFVAALAVVLAGGVAQAKDVGEPANGVPFKVRNGWFAETQLGVFTAFGGSKAVSNAEPFVALSVGLDIPSIQHLSVFFTIGHGYNAASCHALDAHGECQAFKLADGSASAVPENFSVIPLELGVRYGFGDFVPRLSSFVTVVAGYALMTPAIAKDAAIGSPEAGLGGGIEYVTRLDGLTIGAEVLVRTAFAPFLASLAAYPRIKYVF